MKTSRAAAIADELGLTPMEARAAHEQPYHPDPTINREVIADRVEGRAVDEAAGIREGWHRGWVNTLKATDAEQARAAASWQALCVRVAGWCGEGPGASEIPSEEEERQWKTWVATRATIRDLLLPAAGLALFARLMALVSRPT